MDAGSGGLEGRQERLGREEPLKVFEQEAGSRLFLDGYSGCR